MIQQKLVYNPDLFNEHLCTWHQGVAVHALVMNKNNKVMEWCEAKQRLIDQLNNPDIPERKPEDDTQYGKSGIRKQLSDLGTMQDILFDVCNLEFKTNKDWVIEERIPLAVDMNIYRIIATLMYFGSRNRLCKAMKREDALWMTDDMLKDRKIKLNLVTLLKHIKNKTSFGKLYDLHVEDNKFIVDPVPSILDPQNHQGPGYIKWQESDEMLDYNNQMKANMLLDYAELLKNDPILDGVDK